jgi:hypothetical protein
MGRRSLNGEFRIFQLSSSSLSTSSSSYDLLMSPYSQPSTRGMEEKSQSQSRSEICWMLSRCRGGGRLSWMREFRIEKSTKAHLAGREECVSLVNINLNEARRIRDLNNFNGTQQTVLVEILKDELIFLRVLSSGSFLSCPHSKAISAPSRLGIVEKRSGKLKMRWGNISGARII